MFPFLKPYRWAIIGLILTVILPVLMELVVPKALNYVIDQGIQPGNMAAIWRGSGIMFLTVVTGALATLGQGVCRALISQGLAYDIRNKVFAHIQTLSHANLDKIHTGQLMTRLSSDVDMVRGFSGHGLSLLLRSILMLIGSIVMMYVIDWQLALITLVLLPIAGFIIWGLMGLAQPLFKIVQEKLANLNTTVQENLAGVQVVKAFVRERFEIIRFSEDNNNYMSENIKVGRLMAVALPALTMLTNLGIAAVVWIGGSNVLGGRLTMGELIAFNNYLMIGMSPLMLLGNVLTSVSRAEASAARITEILDTHSSIQSAPDAHKARVSKGWVRFEDVIFHYDRDGNGSKGSRDPGSDGYGGRNVLKNISFEVKSGQKVALLGATGSGKSSLVQMIPRFYDVDQGKVCIDGVDVRDWDIHTLRKQIGIVLQQTTLFSGSIKENIAFGKPETPKVDIILAAKASQAHDFIMSMPDGYESFVEERGANLSGGQKQRIAIARALLISPRILILDDCTSAVDLETEAKIQLALEKLMENRTTFIVAQRVSSVLTADHIIVLDHGMIAAQGTHQQLLENCSIYQEIYQSQLGVG